MRTWREAKAAKWEAMSEEERAEYLAAVSEVEAELRAAELVYQTREEAGLTQQETDSI